MKKMDIQNYLIIKMFLKQVMVIDGSEYLVYFKETKDNYKDYRQKIYEHELKFKEDLLPFFILDLTGREDNI